MPSKLVQRLAGTWVEYKLPMQPVLLWATYQCRHGALREAVQKFCAEQSEPLNPALTIVEALTPTELRCCVPCRCADHESNHTFEAEVRFTLDPVSGASRRHALGI